MRLFFALLIGYPLLCSEAHAVKKTELPNGLVILTKPVVTNSIVSVVITLRMGSLYETDDMAGLCTLMQTTLQKGTETRSSEEIALELESMGTRLSTSSNREHGTVEIQSTSESLYRSLEILYDILENATFPEDALALQKQLQIQSIHLRYDQPIYRAMDLMVDAHYGTHPYHKPRMGYPGTIEQLTRGDVVDLCRRVYVPNNMVVTVVGNFDENRLITNITENLGALPRHDELEKALYVDDGRLGRTAPVEQTETRDTAASWFALGWLAPSMHDREYYAMELLDAITGGSMNSRLFIAIREKRGLAYQVSSFYDARYDTGLYVAYIGTKPASYQEAKSVLLDEVYRLADEAPTDEEIRFAKNYLKGMHIMSQESNAGQASIYGYFEILGIGYERVNRYNAQIEAVSASDILRVGGKYLEENYALGGVLAE